MRNNKMDYDSPNIDSIVSGGVNFIRGNSVRVYFFAGERTKFASPKLVPLILLLVSRTFVKVMSSNILF